MHTHTSTHICRHCCCTQQLFSLLLRNSKLRKKDKNVFKFYNFIFVLHLFLLLNACILFLYILCSIFLLHTLLHTHIHTHVLTQTNTFHVNSSHEQYSLLHSFASLSHSLSLSLSERVSGAHTQEHCCVLQLPFCLIFNLSVRLNLHAWLLYVQQQQAHYGMCPRL